MRQFVDGRILFDVAAVSQSACPISTPRSVRARVPLRVEANAASRIQEVKRHAPHGDHVGAPPTFAPASISTMDKPAAAHYWRRRPPSDSCQTARAASYHRPLKRADGIRAVAELDHGVDRQKRTCASNIQSKAGPF